MSEKLQNEINRLTIERNYYRESLYKHHELLSQFAKEMQPEIAKQIYSISGSL